MLIIFICAILEMIKRPIGWILYPFAYLARRNRPRAGGILWFVLDDSIVADNLRRGFPGWEYCGYGKRSALVEKLPEGRFKQFARSFYWGAWRNSWINFMIWTENKIGELYFTPVKRIPVQIAESLPKSNSSEAVPAISPKTAQQRETLLDSLKALNNYLAIMKDIAALFEKYPSDSDIPGLPELMAQHADSRLKIEGAIKTYLNSDPSTNVNTVEAKLDELFDGPVKVWSERVAGAIEKGKTKLC